jgi:hypothetical protein
MVCGARPPRAPDRLDRVLDELRACVRARLAPPELDLERPPREAVPARPDPEAALDREVLLVPVPLAAVLPDRPVDRDPDFGADSLREDVDVPLRGELPLRPASPLLADVVLRAEALAALVDLDVAGRAVDRGRAVDPFSPACLRFASSMTVVRPLCWRS